jgi:hypothetical protein
MPIVLTFNCVILGAGLLGMIASGVFAIIQRDTGFTIALIWIGVVWAILFSILHFFAIFRRSQGAAIATSVFYFLAASVFGLWGLGALVSSLRHITSFQELGPIATPILLVFGCGYSIASGVFAIMWSGRLAKYHRYREAVGM